MDRRGLIAAQRAEGEDPYRSLVLGSLLDTSGLRGLNRFPEDDLPTNDVIDTEVPVWRLWVGNVPPSARMSDLYNAFKRYGRIQSVWMRRNPDAENKNGTAFVHFYEENGPFRAHQEKDGTHQLMLPVQAGSSEMRRYSLKANRAPVYIVLTKKMLADAINAAADIRRHYEEMRGAATAGAGRAGAGAAARDDNVFSAPLTPPSRASQNPFLDDGAGSGSDQDSPPARSLLSVGPSSARYAQFSSDSEEDARLDRVDHSMYPGNVDKGAMEALEAEKRARNAYMRAQRERERPR